MEAIMMIWFVVSVFAFIFLAEDDMQTWRSIILFPIAMPFMIVLLALIVICVPLTILGRVLLGVLLGVVILVFQMEIPILFMLYSIIERDKSRRASRVWEDYCGHLQNVIHPIGEVKVIRRKVFGYRWFPLPAKFCIDLNTGMKGWTLDV